MIDYFRYDRFLAKRKRISRRARNRTFIVHALILTIFFEQRKSISRIAQVTRRKNHIKDLYIHYQKLLSIKIERLKRMVRIGKNFENLSCSIRLVYGNAL